MIEFGGRIDLVGMQEGGEGYTGSRLMLEFGAGWGRKGVDVEVGLLLGDLLPGSMVIGLMCGGGWWPRLDWKLSGADTVFDLCC